MEQKHIDPKTPIGLIPKIDLTDRLTRFTQQAYFRRSRQLPANLTDMVECLKGDLLKHFKDCPIGTVDEAITTSTLFDTDKPVSVAFLFEAVKKKWWQPKTNVHNWEHIDGVSYWQERVNRNPNDREAAEMVEHYRNGDTEADTINLLDTAADIVQRQDTTDQDGNHSPLANMELPAFNPRRTFAYLNMRGQLTDGTADHQMGNAILKVNTDRMKTHHHRLSKEEAEKDPDVKATAMRLAVIDWLRACNTQGRKPSAILNPFADETTYSMHRRENP